MTDQGQRSNSSRGKGKRNSRTVTYRLNNVLPLEDTAAVDNKPSSSGSSSKQQNQRPKKSKAEEKSGAPSKKVHAEKKDSINENDFKNRRSYLTATLTNEDYECMICCDSIKRKDRVWSCDSCCHIFHLSCIDKWAKSSVEDSQLNVKGVFTWRCPSCQYQRHAAPGPYLCFCKKVKDPVDDKFVTPHSCGQTCGQRLHSTTVNGQKVYCPHSCSLPCHPGQCEECEKWITTSCFCGKTKDHVKCKDGSRAKKSCGKVCGALKVCGHSCKDFCHSGHCNPVCLETVVQRCFCGKKFTEKVCRPDGKAELFEFSCGDICQYSFNCMRHYCDQKCHKGHHTKCPYSPEFYKTCPCGRNETVRKSCSDPLPECCGAKCSKKVVLPCGHSTKCKLNCHYSDCLSDTKCNQIITKTCRCGQGIKLQTPCSSDAVNLELCDKICNKNLSCGKHKCKRICCGLSKEEHVCVLPCDKILSCGKHTCSSPCHKGACPACKEVSFDPWICNCGKTVVDPPIYCSTPLYCPYPCMRPMECGHELILRLNYFTCHECHEDSVSCPPCTVFVDKRCRCGKAVMRNVKCSSRPQCSKLCDNLLSCGHRCNQPCHEPPCDTTCSSVCGQFLSCGHVCKSKCHFGKSCEYICNEIVNISCSCGTLKKSLKCCEVQDHVLSCSMVCEQVQRNKRMAEALNLTVKNDGLPTSKIPAPLPDIETFATGSPLQCRSILNRMKEFFENKNDTILRYPPMKSRTRNFIHNFVDAYGLLVGLEAESQDKIPYRSVVVFKRKPRAALGRLSVDMFFGMIHQLLEISYRRGHKHVNHDDNDDVESVENGEKIIHDINPFENMVGLNKACGRDHRHLLNTEPAAKTRTLALLNREDIAMQVGQENDNVKEEEPVDDITAVSSNLKQNLSLEDLTGRKENPSLSIKVEFTKDMNLDELSTKFEANLKTVKQALIDEAIYFEKYPCDCSCLGCNTTFKTTPELKDFIRRIALDNFKLELNNLIVTVQINQEIKDTNEMEWVAWTAVGLLLHDSCEILSFRIL